MLSVQKMTSSQNIAYYQFGDEKPTVVFVHGLFGSGRNWQSYLRFIAEEASLTTVALDQKGHGASPYFSDQDINLNTLVDDLQIFLTEIASSPLKIVGHSLGAKVLIRLAAQNPQLASEIMIVDSNLLPVSSHSVPVLEWLPKVPQQKKKRDYRNALAEYTNDQRLIDFLLTSIEETEDGPRWKIDILGLQKLVTSMHNLDLSTEWKNISCPITLVRGENSSHLTAEQADQMVDLLYPGQVKFQLIEKAGHWCHADNPIRFKEVLKDFIDC